jgi:hypothetical protein
MRLFLYPGWDWAWKKTEKAIARMEELGTKVPDPIKCEEESKKSA